MNSDRGSEQVPGVVQQLSLDEMRLARQAMFAHRTGIDDVEHLVPVRCGIVADQHAVALEVHALGAHDGRRRLRGERDHLGRAAPGAPHLLKADVGFLELCRRVERLCLRETPAWKLSITSDSLLRRRASPWRPLA